MLEIDDLVCARSFYKKLWKRLCRRQIDALTAAGCEKIFQEKVSGVKADRQELQLLLQQIRKGDTVVVSKLVRFGRSLKDLITNVNLVQEKGADFVSLTEKIDTTTPSGKFMFT